MITACHKTCDVSHIYHQVSAYHIRDLTEALEIDLARICACTRDDELGIALLRDALHLVVIDETVVIDTVRNDVKVRSGEVHRAAVRQVPAVCEVHTHHGVTGLEQCELYSHIGLCAGVRLNIDILATEQFLRALNRKIFRDVHTLASAVVTLAGISLRILVREHAAHRSHNGLADQVLGGDQLNVLSLTAELGLNAFGKFRINRFHIIE